MAELQTVETEEQEFLPLRALERFSRPLVWLFTLLLVLASLWGMVELWRLWSRPLDLVVGTPGAVREVQTAGGVRYRLQLALGTGEELDLWLHNNSPVLDYLISRPVTTTLALRYWTDDMSVAGVYPLTPDTPPVQVRRPPSPILLATSILGLALALLLLLSGRPDRAFQGLLARGPAPEPAGARRNAD